MSTSSIQQALGQTPILIQYASSVMRKEDIQEWEFDPKVVAPEEDTFTIYFENQTFITFLHHQDCCETVTLQDVEGDIRNLLFEPLVVAEIASSGDADVSNEYGSQTWSFYRFATTKGWVLLRFLGESNGYYSEEVSMDYGETPLEVHQAIESYYTKTVLEKQVQALEEQSLEEDHPLQRRRSISRKI